MEFFLFTAGWSAAATDLTSPWIQATFDQTMNLRRISTQGRDVYPQWVTKYKVSTSSDALNFEFICNTDLSSDCTYPGNDDANVVVTNDLPDDVTALAVRVHVVTYDSHPSLRWGVCGTPGQ